MSFFEDFLIEPSIFSICFMVFTRHESDLIELMPSYLLKKAKKSVKS
jgi:hypothetical protein